MGGKLKKAIIYGIAGLLGIIVVIAGSAMYTSRSSFCITCHYMQPFYDSWKASRHGKVECVECHFAPGLKNKLHGKMMGLVQLVKYATRAYKKSRPWAEIPDESCLRKGCHETRLLTGQVMFREGVVFDHKPHLTELKRGKKLRCTSCHSQIVQGSHMKVTEGTCYLCHFKAEDGAPPKNAACTLCHTKETMLRNSRSGLLRYDHSRVIQTGLSCVNCHTSTVAGEGLVHKETCFACHWDNARLNKYSDTTLMHDRHIAKSKIECMRCHMSIEHRIDTHNVSAIASCASCHPNHHSEMVTLFTGEGGRGAAPRPNKMLQIGVNCRGCHISHGVETGGKRRGKTFVASPAACDKCHGAGFLKLVRNWQATALNDVAELRKAVAGVKAASGASQKARQGVAGMLEDAEYNLGIVENGNIVHNVKYANDLLAAAGGMIQKSAKSLNVSVKLPAFGARDKKPYTGCLTCHFYIEKITPAFAGLVYFSHKNHLDRGLECQRCHSIAVKHGELILDKDKCAPCHHRETVKKACPECHKLQTGILGGKWDILDEPSVMSEEFPCTDCHTEKVRRVTPSDCETCHVNPEYAEKMIKWTQETGKGLEEIEAAVKRLEKTPLTEQQSEKLKKLSAFAKGLRDDGSGGMHNPKAIRKALKSYLKMAGELSGVPPPAIH